MQNKFTYNYEAPSDLYKITDNVYQFAILHYLIQLQNGYDKVYANMETLRLGKMSKFTVNEAIKRLVELGYVTKIISPNFTKHIANEYIVNFDNINHAILKTLDTKTLSDKAKKEYSEQQKDAMSIKRMLQKPELLDKAIMLNKTIGYDVKTGDKGDR